MKKVVLLLLLISFANLYAATPEIDEKTLHHKITKKEQRAINSGNRIIAALEEYYKDNGYYPQELDEIVPKYLPEIEETGIYDWFVVPSLFEYEAEPVKYRPGYFLISYPDYEKGKVKEDMFGNETYYSCYYDSRDDKVKPSERGGFSKELEWIDKISEKDIRIIADAVKQYFNDYREFPKKLCDVVPEYLSALPITLEPRYMFKNVIPRARVEYEYQNPLKDDESEFAQCYKLRFKYNRWSRWQPCYEFAYYTYHKKWICIVH
ncbi:MAG: hypothetical protein IKZ86_15480 [Spirochaetaceae bacterium]|nr:hypothetical protein [Spirochaetaceae bacterium]